MAEVCVIATDQFVVCTDRPIPEAPPCGKIIRIENISDHWWQKHRASRPAPPSMPDVRVDVFVLPRVQHWPMDYYRWRYPWTDEGLMALDEIEETGAMSFAELDNLIRKQRYIQHRVLNWGGD